ncbi:hypothetical protein BRARA_I05600 [Brassica rapa]|uniref:Uncharacterized protein n=1 Tax=Brassica campestris TaxID=3711 RepID=A0A397Y8G7_BRACM|nr:hypothetical protein BRARA_I05600 [Brassica rapa]RID49139.1 hypothetical protein BRARA_I05600 [Brassica rapa]
MGAAEVRALWQRRASRCFLVHEDATMPPRLACRCHHHHHQQQQHPSSSSGKNSFSSTSFGDSSDFSSDTKWWLKGGSSGFDEEIANSFLQDTKLHQFVDLTGVSKEAKDEEEYSFISKKDTATTPWWRSATDQDELALLVSTRSVDHHIQNCDLPPPQKLHKSIQCTTNGEKGFQTAVIKSPWKQGAWSDRFESSSNSTDSKNTSPKSSPQSDDLISKAQLLEALRHSQTRAREAEEAAKEACAEKDRLITVLMRQASQILAYKQWIKLLEMEALYLHMEEVGEQEQIEGMNLKKRKQRGKKKNKKMGEFGRYVMAFALGFSLIGAGLLLGWTVGWLFPF